MAIYRLGTKVSGQVSTYSALSNKPQINSVELSGNITGTELGLVSAETGKGLSTNDFTNALKTKLDGIETGAEVNVQSNWTETDTTSDAYIQNKPSTFTPSAHAQTHALSGGDAITIAQSQVSGLTTALNGKADSDDIPTTLAELNGDTTHRTVTDAQITTWTNKQNAITSDNKLSATLVQTSDSNLFVSSTEKSTWNAKQNALNFDTTPTASSTNPVTSGGVYTAINGIQQNVNDVQLNGTSILSNKVANITTVDNVTSTSTNPLSANQGKILNDRINNISSIGRYLSHWNCATGLATSDPTTSPYTYHTGDYFVISVVSTTTNYKPNGPTYTTGVASTTTTSDPVAVNDIWRYDGTTWQFELNHAPQGDAVTDVKVNGQTVVSGGIATIPNASSSNTGTLTSTDWSTFNAKQDALTIEQSPSTSTTAIVSSNGIRTALAGKVDTETGKGLSTNDFTTAEKTKLSGIETGAQVNVKPNWNSEESETTGILNKPSALKNPYAVSFVKDGVTTPYDGSSAVTVNIPTGGSGTVYWGDIEGTLSNQTDLNTALTGKQDVLSSSNQLNADYIATTTSKQFVTSTQKASWDDHLSDVDNPHDVTKSQVGLGNCDNTSDANKPISTATQTALNGKQNTLSSSNMLSADYVDDTSTTHKFISASEKETWNNKQPMITSTNMLESDLVTDTDQTHKFVTSSQISTWTNKQDTLTAGTNVSISGNTITVSGTTTVSSSGVGLISQAGLYKRIQYGSTAPSNPSDGDVWIDIS